MMNKKANNIPWDRIESRLKELGRDQQWLRERLGLSPAVITNWKSRGAPAGKTVQVAQALDLSTDQLLGIESPADLRGALLVTDDDDLAPVMVPIALVPDHVRAGITGFEADRIFESDEHLFVPRQWMEENDLSPGVLRAVRIRGDSMIPMMYEGDVAVVNIRDTSRVNGGVFALNFKGEPVIKRLKYDRREWYLTSENPEFKQEPCRTGDCNVIGRVVRFEPRNFKDRL